MFLDFSFFRQNKEISVRYNHTRLKQIKLQQSGQAFHTVSALAAQHTHLFEGIQEVAHSLLLVQILHLPLLLWHRHSSYRRPEHVRYTSTEVTMHLHLKYSVT